MTTQSPRNAPTTLRALRLSVRQTERADGGRAGGGKEIGNGQEREGEGGAGEGGGAEND